MNLAQNNIFLFQSHVNFNILVTYFLNANFEKKTLF